MSPVTFTLDKDFGYVILGVTGIALHYFTASRYIMPLRKKYGIKYPDMGSGIYAQKLDEKKWTEFNNAQRVHYNYLEQLPIALPLALFSGLFQAKITAAGCVSYILGRELYMRGYMSKGSDGRYRGAPFMYPTLIAWLGITVHGAAKMVGWF